MDKPEIVPTQDGVWPIGGGWAVRPIVVHGLWGGSPAKLLCRALVSPSGKHWWQQMLRVPDHARSALADPN